MDKNRITASEKLLGLYWKEYKIQRAKAKKRPMQGTIQKGTFLVEKGDRGCLRKSFIASEMGWSIPINETLLGPLRRWE